MWVRHLTLTNFRNYASQELDLPRGVALMLGDNAQGKSNLLEAVFLLATTRSPRAGVDAELIRREALGDPQPVARLVAEVERGDGPLQLELVVAGRPRPTGDGFIASKRLRVNGVPRRAHDVVGQLTAVLFTTEDIELIGGSPGERRRFLDVMLSQLDHAYARALQQYTKVVTQRNALLRRIQEGAAKADELSFWDEELAGLGAVIVRGRAASIDAIAAKAGEAHRELSGGREELGLAYEPRLPGWDGERAAAATNDELAAALRAALEGGRNRDIGAGQTLTGPHRDDLAFALDGTPAAAFASRGQQRTAALALRLAEARFLAERKGDLPVVLLDDVLSELDDARRRAVLSSLGGWDQLLITSADPVHFGEGLPDAAAVLRVTAGQVEAE
jgi:DNA replication and repair protein RecF